MFTQVSETFLSAGSASVQQKGLQSVPRIQPKLQKCDTFLKSIKEPAIFLRTDQFQETVLFGKYLTCCLFSQLWPLPSVLQPGGSSVFTLHLSSSCPTGERLGSGSGTRSGDTSDGDTSAPCILNLDRAWRG